MKTRMLSAVMAAFILATASVGGITASAAEKASAGEDTAETTAVDEDSSADTTETTADSEGVISIDTYADHTAELDGLAYELGLTAVDDVPVVETPTAETEDIDRPLFTDAAVIDEIQRNENADVPFWEMPEAQGEQLSLFGDPDRKSVV